MRLIVYYLLIIQKFFNIENINANLNYNQFNNLENLLQYSDTFFVNLKSTFCTLFFYIFYYLNMRKIDNCFFINIYFSIVSGKCNSASFN